MNILGVMCVITVHKSHQVTLAAVLQEIMHGRIEPAAKPLVYGMWKQENVIVFPAFLFNDLFCVIFAAVIDADYIQFIAVL